MMIGNSGNVIRAVSGWYAFRENEKKRFLSEGEPYTRGFLDAYRGLKKLWAIVTGDGRYYGAIDAQKTLAVQHHG